MIDVYLPLPLTPLDENKDPYVLFRFGKIHNIVESGQKFRLTNTIFENQFFDAMITGYYQDKVLVKLFTNERVIEQSLDLFFRGHNSEDYRKLSNEEYWLLYPEEHKLLDSEGCV